MGVYLGPSPHHARTVHMILSTQSGHVSPQFHVRFDDMFETLNDKINVPPSRWQAKCGLTSQLPQVEPRTTWMKSPNHNTTFGTSGDEPNIGAATGGEQNEQDEQAGLNDNEQDSRAGHEDTDIDQIDHGPEDLQHESDETAIVQQATVPDPMLEGTPMHANNQAPNVDPNVDQARKWSSRHKPTSRLRG